MSDISSFLYSMAWLIPLFPVLSALWIAVGYITGKNRGESGERLTSRIALGGITLSLCLILAIDLVSLFSGSPGQIELMAWLESGEYHVGINFLLDPFGLVMMTLVGVIALLTIRFSINYLHREAGYQRFFLVLSLFSSAMLLIVMAGNAVLMFIGWELAGTSSYLLIAYAYNRTNAATNATRAFVTNRIGDAGFILGVFLCFLWLNGLEWNGIATDADTLSPLAATLIGGSFLVAALAKSAQVPFAGWIARALEGPTPSSAIFYGALMVHAGVYLLLRLEPVITQAPVLMLVLVVLGILSALYGFLSSLVQTDIKSSLMFSTTAQVGLMFLACGLGWFELAAWHLVLHAIWRAYQFLHAPALMHLVSRTTRPVPRWLANNHWLYNAALRRFWLDQAGDAMLVKPTNALATDLQNFDDRVVTRLVGLPNRCSAVSSLNDCQSSPLAPLMPEGEVGRGRGVAGRLMEWLATSLHWFEEHLILKGGGEGLITAIHTVGKYMQQIELLLGQPRYLVLLAAATFVVII